MNTTSFQRCGPNKKNDYNRQTNYRGRLGETGSYRVTSSREAGSIPNEDQEVAAEDPVQRPWFIHHDERYGSTTFSKIQKEATQRMCILLCSRLF